MEIFNSSIKNLALTYNPIVKMPNNFSDLDGKISSIAMSKTQLSEVEKREIQAMFKITKVLIDN